jgi:hypothetical protein
MHSPFFTVWNDVITVDNYSAMAAKEKVVTYVKARRHLPRGTEEFQDKSHSR